jgi:hypothetical protein
MGLELSTKYPHFVWYRLATIASEDIGPAENSITILVDTLRRNYVEAAKKTKRPGEDDHPCPCRDRAL